MATVNLTVRKIEAARTQARSTGTPVLLWDDELRGFGVRVSDTGRASYIVKKRLGAGGRQAKQVKQVIGDYAVLTLEEAKGKAIAAIAEIGRGTDLGNQKRQLRRAQHKVYQSGKLADVVDNYIKKNAKPGRYWAEVARIFDADVYPVLGKSTLLAEISFQDVRSLVQDKEDRSQAAGRNLYATINPFFRWCVQRGLIETSPTEKLTPPKTVKARDRILSDVELKACWGAATRLSYPLGQFVQLLLLTGQRRTEVASMEWTEIDVDNSLWVIPKGKTKNGQEHTVHLSSQARAVISSIKKGESDYVLTIMDSKPLTGYSTAKQKLDALMKAELGSDLKSFRLHDLRRNCASGMARLGTPPHIVERVLNHLSGVNGGLVSVYNRHEYMAERKHALERFGAFIEQLTTGRDKNNVIPLRA